MFDPASGRSAVRDLEQFGHLGLGEPPDFGAAFFEAIARMQPVHSMCAGSRLATKRANARIADSRWLRVCTEQPRSSSRWSRNWRTRRGVRSSIAIRSTGLRILVPTNGRRRRI